MAYRLELEQQVTQKLDVSTSHILANIEKFAGGKQSKQLAYGSDELSLKFAIWMNIHALARYRPIEVEFAEVNMGLTIPKTLILSLLAARMLCFSYSHCAALFNSKQVDKLDPDAIAKLAAVSHQCWREPRKVVVPAGVITNKPPYHSRFETATDGTRVDTANTEFADLPESLKKRFEEKATLTYKWKVAQERTVSLTSFGNTLVVELLGLPMVAKKLKRWTLQQVRVLASMLTSIHLDCNMILLRYLLVSGTVCLIPVTLNGQRHFFVRVVTDNRAIRQQGAPVELSARWHDHYYSTAHQGVLQTGRDHFAAGHPSGHSPDLMLHRSPQLESCLITPTFAHTHSLTHSLAHCTLHPQVGWWDSAKQDWSTVGISEVKVETVASGENGVLRFHTVHVGHFRMVQPRNLDIPYHYWEVKPYGSKGALMLSIITRHHENGAQRVR